MAECAAAGRAALAWALSAANASLDLLNRPSAGPQFGRFVGHLQARAALKLRSLLLQRAVEAHPSALGLAEDTLRQGLSSALLPFHRRQVC